MFCFLYLGSIFPEADKYLLNTVFNKCLIWMNSHAIPVHLVHVDLINHLKAFHCATPYQLPTLHCVLQGRGGIFFFVTRHMHEVILGKARYQTRSTISTIYNCLDNNIFIYT